MKPKLILCLALVLLMLAAHGIGSTLVYEINRTNLNASYSFLLIKSNHDNAGDQDIIHFRVAVMMPNVNHHPADFDGILTIKDGEKFVGKAEVKTKAHDAEKYFPNIPKKFRDETVEYNFSISPQYLSNSDFMVYDYTCNSGYQFALKDFTDEK